MFCVLSTQNIAYLLRNGLRLIRNKLHIVDWLDRLPAMQLLGDKIRTHRKALKLSQGQFAKKLGVSLRQVQYWEAGKSKPSYENMGRLAQSLGLTEAQLINQSTQPGKFVAPLEDVTMAAFHAAKAAASKVIEEDKVIRTKIQQMPLCDFPPLPLAGVAAADEKQGREYDPNEEKGEVVINATNCRTVTVRGDSAKDYVWDGQQVIIDADRTAANSGKPCIIYTKDGLLRLKRKVKADNGTLYYESINAAYPPFQVARADVLAEWPVVGVITESRVRSPVETVDEGPAPKQLKPSTRKKNK